MLGIFVLGLGLSGLDVLGLCMCKCVCGGGWVCELTVGTILFAGVNI